MYTVTMRRLLVHGAALITGWMTHTNQGSLTLTVSSYAVARCTQHEKSTVGVINLELCVPRNKTFLYPGNYVHFCVRYIAGDLSLRPPWKIIMNILHCNNAVIHCNSAHVLHVNKVETMVPTLHILLYRAVLFLYTMYSMTSSPVD